MGMLRFMLSSCVCLAIGCGSDPATPREDATTTTSTTTAGTTDAGSATSVDADTTSAAPTVTEVSAPTSAVSGEPAPLSFVWADPEGDIAVLTATRTNALGTVSVRL